MNEELKPCPFCGGKAKLIINKDLDITYRIRCKNLNCDARPSTSWFNHIDDAVKHWNTRKPIENIVEQLEIEKNDYEKRYHEDVLKYNNVVHNATMQGNIHGLHMAIEIVKGSEE